MKSYTEYYSKRLNDQKLRLQLLENNTTIVSTNITGKKRKYEEAMGYKNDYEVVQNPESIKTNNGLNWVDAYLENLNNKIT